MNKKILYIGKGEKGSIHDYRLLKMEIGREVFENKKVYVDLGFMGIEKEYKYEELEIPEKRSKNKREVDTEKNKEKAKRRIKVEQAISGLKRYRILAERLRIHIGKLYDKILGICAGLWNFYLETSESTKTGVFE